MKNTLTITLLVALLAFACSEKKDEEKTQEDQTNWNIDPDNGGIGLPEGFAAVVAADELGKAGHMIAADNGDLYVQLRKFEKGYGIVAMRDTDADGKFDEQETFADFAGTGLGIHNGYLYASSDTSVHRFKMNASNLLPEAQPELVVSGFPPQNQHETKSLAFDGSGGMYVNIGAPSNACMEKTRTKGSPGMDPCPLLEQHAGIWKVDPSKTNQHIYTDGNRYSTGTRNVVALDWNFQDNQLYAVQHGRDQLHQFFPELYSEEESSALPSEEFLRVTEGADFGWPYCYYDQIQAKKLLMPEYGGDKVTVGRCEDKDLPEIGFPGHIAPNDLVFYTGDMFPEKYKNGAFIAFHGSWNRSPEQYGFFVVFVPFKDGRVAGDYEIFASGFEGESAVQSPGNANYRPCGLAVAPDGSLYISDDAKGRIWKVVYQG